MQASITTIIDFLIWNKEIISKKIITKLGKLNYSEIIDHPKLGKILIKYNKPINLNKISSNNFAG